MGYAQIQFVAADRLINGVGLRGYQCMTGILDNLGHGIKDHVPWLPGRYKTQRVENGRSIKSRLHDNFPYIGDVTETDEQGAQEESHGEREYEQFGHQRKYQQSAARSSSIPPSAIKNPRTIKFNSRLIKAENEPARINDIFREVNFAQQVALADDGCYAAGSNFGEVVPQQDAE